MTRLARWVRHALVILTLSGIMAGVSAAIFTTARAQDDENDQGGLRDEDSPPPQEETRNQTNRSSPPPRLSSTPPAPTARGAASEPMNASGGPNRLDVDVWVETWFSRAIDIHKVLPDGEREGQARVVRMYYNLSVEAYAKDSRPFRYTIWVGDTKVNEGVATWKLHWVTSVTQDLFNISIEITQDGKTRRAEWARIIGVPGEDAGIGGKGGQDTGQGPLTQEVPVGFIDRLTWKLIFASLVEMIAAFLVVGGLYLNHIERLGWQRIR